MGSGSRRGDPGRIELRARGGAVEIPLLVVPGASRERIVGAHGGRLKLAVTAPPEGGAANRAVARRLAAALGRRPREVSLLVGHGSRRKIARVESMTVEEARERLELAGDR